MITLTRIITVHLDDNGNELSKTDQPVRMEFKTPHDLKHYRRVLKEQSATPVDILFTFTTVEGE